MNDFSPTKRFKIIGEKGSYIILGQVSGVIWEMVSDKGIPILPHSKLKPCKTFYSIESAQCMIDLFQGILITEDNMRG